MKTIAVDIDDVLSASAAGFTDFSNKRWGLNLNVKDYNENLMDFWGVDLGETEKRAQEFYNCRVMIDYGCIDCARSVLDELKYNYRLEIITSRRKASYPETAEWVEKNFPEIFKRIHYSGIFEELDHNKLKMTKKDICLEIGADFLIDDQPKHCLAAAEAGLTALLFGDYPWNQTEYNLPQRVTRVNSWEEVKNFFLELT